MWLVKRWHIKQGKRSFLTRNPPNKLRMVWVWHRINDFPTFAQVVQVMHGWGWLVLLRRGGPNFRVCWLGRIVRVCLAGCDWLLFRTREPWIHFCRPSPREGVRVETLISYRSELLGCFARKIIHQTLTARSCDTKACHGRDIQREQQDSEILGHVVEYTGVEG